MLTLIPSMFVGSVGVVLTAILLAADWYIWNFRYWIFRKRASELVTPAEGKDIIYVPSASGRELVTLAPQSLDRNTPPLHPVEGEWPNLGAQG